MKRYNITLYRIRSWLYWQRIARDRAEMLRRRGYDAPAPLFDRVGTLLGVLMIGAALGAAVAFGFTH